MRLGIGSYTFAWAIGVPGHSPEEPMSAFDLLREAARLGVQVLQVCDNLPLTQLSKGELDRFEEQARDSGISIEIGTRGLQTDRLRANLELCVRFASPFCRIVIDSPGDEPAAHEVVGRLRTICEEFAARGIRLAIENHDRFNCETLVRIVHQLGADRVGICLDTVNSFGALEPPAMVVPALSPLTLCVHVKDFVIRRVSHQMGFVIEGCPAGQGRLDVPWLLKQARAHARSANAILETWVTPGNSLAETIARERSWAEQGVRYLRALIPL